VTLTHASQRFALINDDLAERERASISVGLTELDADDRLEELLQRADDAMYQSRKQARSPGS